MLEAALAGIVAGYAIAIPVGAIAVLIIHVGLVSGLRAGLAAASGAATADGIYATLAGLAGLALASAIAPLLGPLRIVGGAILILIALRGLAVLRSPRDGTPADGLIGHRSHGRTYLSLLGLTLLNPATVVYFAALTVGLHFLGGLGERLVFAAAAFAASLSWQWLLAVFGAFAGRRSGSRLRRPTVIVGSLVIAVLGGLILVEGVRALA